jgi:hypothetical protein
MNWKLIYMIFFRDVLMYKSQQDAQVTEFIDMDMSYTRVLHPKVAHSVSHK